MDLCKRFSGLYLPAIFLMIVSAARSNSSPVFHIKLDKHWYMKSSAQVQVKGDEISRTDFAVNEWYAVDVPATVMAGLVKNGRYPDLYYNNNLELVDKSLFKVPWWYRTEFDMHDDLPDHTQLIFEGINYRADVWLNGTKIASSDTLFGAFRIFNLDITPWLKKYKNVLAVKVHPPKPGDFTIGFVDWNPRPPDENMGIWRDVKLKSSGAVSVEYPFVQSKIDLETLKKAELNISAEVQNHLTYPVTGSLTAIIEKISLYQKFSLSAGEKKIIVFNADKYEKLIVNNPRIWWPTNYGNPELYQLELTASVNNKISDKDTIQFGIREVSDYINEQGYRGYTINGQKILIRGGGWVDDLLLTNNEKKLEAQFRYIKHMNLNCIRLEGFWGNGQLFYNMADKYGILVMAGFSCHWEWKNYLGKDTDNFGGVKSEQDMELVSRYFKDHLLWLRNHPGIFVWVVGSDMLPRPALEKKYRSLLNELDPTRPYLSSCASRTSEVSGPSAVKMNGPYDYVPPVYWYTDTENGGAFGFNTETGPGPQPPPVESIKKMIPKEHLWPIDETWNYHCARNEFSTMNRYLNAFEKRYGPANDLESFALKSQIASYEAMRAMFEAFTVNKYKATGIVQWMLNSAWPETYWQLYDYFLMPNGAFYGTRRAGERLNVVYNYGENHIYIVNDGRDTLNDLKTVIRIFNDRSREIYNSIISVNISPNSVTEVADLTATEIPANLFFLDLKVIDKQGSIAGRNFYWLSQKQDVMDYTGHKWFVTPQKEFADFSGLNQLPQAEVTMDKSVEVAGEETVVKVKLHNTANTIAFGIELRIDKENSGQAVVPVFWDDNYISLLPGESRTISARVFTADLKGLRPVVRMNGWNTD